MNTFTKTLLASGATASLLAFGIQSAQAAVFTTNCADASFCTLDELINGTGGFELESAGGTPLISITQFDLAPISNILPNVDSTTFTIVETFAGPSGGSFELQFDSSSLGTNTETANTFAFNYNVTAFNGAQIISSSIDGTTFVGTNTDSTIDLDKGLGSVVNQDDLGQLSVASNANGSDSTTITPSSSVFVEDIALLSSVDGQQINLTDFNQGFGYEITSSETTPEPGTILGLGLVGLGALVSRKRKG